MKIVSLLIVALLFSCGKKSSGGGKGGGPEVVFPPFDPSAVSWEVDSSSVNFPAKFAILVKNVELFDTCQNPGGVTITAGTNGRTAIAFSHDFVPSQTFRVEIIDRGACDQRVSWHAVEHAVYSSATITDENGNVLSQQVYVTLQN